MRWGGGRCLSPSVPGLPVSHCCGRRRRRHQWSVGGVSNGLHWRRRGHARWGHPCLHWARQGSHAVCHWGSWDPYLFCLGRNCSGARGKHPRGAVRWRWSSVPVRDVALLLFKVHWLCPRGLGGVLQLALLAPQLPWWRRRRRGVLWRGRGQKRLWDFLRGLPRGGGPPLQTAVFHPTRQSTAQALQVALRMAVMARMALWCYSASALTLLPRPPPRPHPRQAPPHKVGAALWCPPPRPTSGCPQWGALTQAPPWRAVQGQGTVLPHLRPLGQAPLCSSPFP